MRAPFKLHLRHLARRQVIVSASFLKVRLTYSSASSLNVSLWRFFSRSIEGANFQLCVAWARKRPVLVEIGATLEV